MKPEFNEEYLKTKPLFLAADDYAYRTPGLFKMEFRGNRMTPLTSNATTQTIMEKERSAAKGSIRDKTKRPGTLI